MTRTEAIDLLDNLIGMIEDNHESDYDTAFKMAIQALKEPTGDLISRDLLLERMADYVASGYADSVEDFEEYSKIVCQLPSAEKPKWIPDSERLPQVNEWVLCQCRTCYKVLKLTSYRCYRNDIQEYMDSFVIEWMPLPSLFEPQEGE